MDNEVDDLSGVVLDGRYAIVEPLSTGGQGVVYRGRQLALDRPVAIKLVKAGVKDREQQIERLVREAQTTAMVKHPNVIEIIDVGVMDRGLVYLVMELLEGVDLRTLLRRERRLPWSRVRLIALQVVAALKAAHARGVIHRDIKPSNVFLVRQAEHHGGDFIKVLDFGLAKCTADGRTPTLTGDAGVVGTPAYLAPEVARGRKADARSEIYAVGILMYEMATGTVPFKGSNPIDVLARAISNPLPAPRSRNPELPESADRLIRRCLAKRPDLRPKDMDALEMALHALGGDARGAGVAEPVAAAVSGAIDTTETTQVAPAPLAPPPSVPRVQLPAAPLPPVPAFAEDPSDVLEAAMSEVLELEVADAPASPSRASGFKTKPVLPRPRSKPALHLVPDPEPSPLPDVLPEPFADDPSLGPVVQSQTAVAPLPPRPPDVSLDERFAADLPRDPRGFAPALSPIAEALPPLRPVGRDDETDSSRRFLLLMLSVPAVVAVLFGGLWLGGAFEAEAPTEIETTAAAAVAAAVEVAPVPVAVEELAAPVPALQPGVIEDPVDPPPVAEPAPEPTPEAEPQPEAEPTPKPQAEPAPVAKPKAKTSKKRRPRPARPDPEPVAVTRRPPPPPPVVPKKKTTSPAKKKSATDTSAPWKRVPVPSDNW